jgi:hypothetical protein
VYWQREEASVFFFEKRSKKFLSFWRAQDTTWMQTEKSFFGSFFKKRTVCLPFTCLPLKENPK